MFVDYFNAFLSLPVYVYCFRYFKNTIIEGVFSRAVVKLQQFDGTDVFYFNAVYTRVSNRFL